MNSKGIFDTDFKVVWQGQFVSQLGTSAHLIGFAFYLKSATQSAGIVGTVSFITGLLALAALPFAGVICACFVGFALANQLRFAIGCLFVAGLANGYWSVFFETGIQSSIPRNLLGRAFATLGLASAVAVPISTLCTGFLLEGLSQNTQPVFLACASAMTVMPIGLFLFSSNYHAFFAQLRK